MTIQTINPATGKEIKSYPLMSQSEIEAILESSHHAFLSWRKTNFSERAQKMKSVADILLKNKEAYADIITQEMGKLPDGSRAEVEKCATLCNYFAENAEKFLAQRTIKTEMTKSFVCYNPLGTILAIMPWNFPFWQVFRFAVPALMAGNAGILKHAPITTCCALTMEKIFRDAGFPEHLFRVLVVEEKAVESVIKHPKIAAVTITGSPRAGGIVAAEAGSVLKKIVLELGGSDPYIILEDADLPKAAETIVKGRMQNSGQSCIAPKRLLAIASIRQEFEKLVLEKVDSYHFGDAKDPKVNLAPLARADLRDLLHQQIQQSIAKGATLLRGGVLPEGPGFYYPATVLTNVKKGMPAYDDELFGPVITLIDVKDEQDAIRVANDTRYGLGAAIFTQNLERGEKIATQDIEAGQCFVNDVVRSDPRLPFGGVKGSGFGRELSEEGIKEFVNIKTVVVK